MNKNLVGYSLNKLGQNLGSFDRASSVTSEHVCSVTSDHVCSSVTSDHLSSETNSHTEVTELCVKYPFADFAESDKQVFLKQRRCYNRETITALNYEIHRMSFIPPFPSMQLK